MIRTTGNSLSLFAASIATITTEDLRLWFIALAGLAITLWGNWHKRYKDSLEAQRARQELCNLCLKSGVKPRTCAAKEEHRPGGCPLTNKKHGE